VTRRLDWTVLLAPACLASVLVACGSPSPADAGRLDAGRLDAGRPDAFAPGPIRSRLYPEGWDPDALDAEGRALPDFSFAGYRHGEVALGAGSSPRVIDAVADPTGASDSTAAIQSAIDVASMGGGVVALGPGLYRVDGALRVQASGVVIRGEGSDRTRLHFTASAAMSYRAHLTFEGAVTSDLEVRLAEDAAPRATEVSVEDTGALAVGDDVELGWVISPAFVEAHRMTGVWGPFADTWQPFFRRTIVALDGSARRVTLDVPLRYAALVRDGASLRRVRGALHDVGIESVGVANAVSSDEAWAEDQVHAIEMSGVIDGWIRDVSSFPSPSAPTDGEDAGAHLASGGILVRASNRVTIADCVLAQAQNLGPDGNGYLFEVRASSEVLVRDCEGRAGRHAFIQNWGFGTSGCVWLRVHSVDGHALASRGGLSLLGPSEFHHSLAMANLVDSSVLDDGWVGVNRREQSSGAGHSATENVFWNSAGGGVIRSFQFGWGYVIGTGPELEVVTRDVPWESLDTEPEDFTEALGRAADLEPRSLYEDQLRRRLAR
jgi:hypothetical protein